MSEAEAAKRAFSWVKEGEAQPREMEWGAGSEQVRNAIAEALNARNVAFLLGAGCSSLRTVTGEVGIPTMGPLAAEFCGASHSVSSPSWVLTTEEKDYLATLGLNLSDYNSNLESLMEVLFAQQLVLRRSKDSRHAAELEVISGIIAKVQHFLVERVSKGEFTNNNHTVRDLYERFYRKLVLRDRALPRPWVFSTNYDLFSETAMDRLGIPYANGFIGTVERRFNPASFRYSLAEQLDVSSRRWAAVDAFVYLCKLHGSVSWTEDDHGLFPIREIWPAEKSSKVMIYPTPAKQNASLTSPYADLFREFQVRIVREQSVLITIGYAFGDQHLNNIIYQALTIPTFRLIVFASPDSRGEIEKLRKLQDPRIWIIGGDGPAENSRAHYFDVVVDQFLPQRSSERIDEAVRKVLLTMSSCKEGAA